MADDIPSVVVTNSAGLYAAIKAAQAGDQILLAPGSYDKLSLSNFNPTSGVTFGSLDPTNPAKVAGIYAVNSSNITFKDLDVSVDPRQGYAVTLGHCKNVTIDHLNIHGTGVGNGNGALVRDCTNVTISNSEIHDIGTGFSHLDSSNVVFSNNRFHDLQADAIHGGGTSNITISGNHFTNFFPKAGDHPDAIQFWTTNTTGPAHDITVADNTIVRGLGAVVQGIFIGSEWGFVYENVTITGNKIIGAMYNGIALSTANNVLIDGNVVQGYQDMTSWIAFKNTTNAIVTNNLATEIKNLGANLSLVYGTNNLVPAAVIGDLGGLSLLHPTTSPPLEAIPPPLPPLEVVLPPLMAFEHDGFTFSFFGTLAV